jgi:hypothetical protein
MTAFDDIPLASFDGISFPVDEVRIRGGLRDHVHEYPHSPGGAPEKLGRKLYEFQLRANFQVTFPGHHSESDPLWPDRLKALRDLFERQTTADLVIPTLGVVACYATSWEQEANAKILSGERANFSFREDLSQDYLAASLVLLNTESLAEKGPELESQLIKDGLLDEDDPSIFDSITDAINIVIAFGDQSELAGNLFEAKLLAVRDLIREADETADDLNDPKNHLSLQLLKDSWFLVQDTIDNLQAEQDPLITWVVPRTMTIQEVAIAIYGDTSRAVEIMQLNPIEDPFEIPKGTSLRVYQAQPTDQRLGDNQSAVA